MEGDSSAAPIGTVPNEANGSNPSHDKIQAKNGSEMKNDKSKKQSKSKSWNKNKKKKEPWYRNRGEKRQKLESDCAHGEAQKEKLKNNRRQDDWESKAPKDIAHEGSFAHQDMQKMFNVQVDVPLKGDMKIPKRKLGILISFLGTNYGGFQINAGQRTLQAQLELALFRAGIISSFNFGWPSKYSWSNSARTDKGVHAAAQVCSLKGEMIFHTESSENSIKDQLDAMREKINEHLPDDIRVLDIERVTRQFCARTNRDKVRYQYMVPSYMLCPQEQIRSAFDVAKHVIPDKQNDKLTPMEASNIVMETITPEVLEHARKQLVGYRTTVDQMNSLKDALKVFEGTHPFHNYTRRMSPNDASVNRYIISFVTLDPIIVEDMEWIPVQVTGQSFLLNQIRKMVSAAVDLARGAVTRQQIQQSLTRQCRMKVNVAPAQGLFLDRSFFEIYNKQLEKKVQSTDHRSLHWVEKDEIPPAVKRIEEFKNEKIIPHIVDEEAREGNFLKYLYCQDVLYVSDMYGTLDESESRNAQQSDGAESDRKTE